MTVTKFLSTEKVRSLEVFSALQEDEIQKIVQLGNLNAYEDREIAFFEGDAVQDFFVLCSGELKIFRTSLDGREQIFARLHSGAFPNLVPLLTKKTPRYPASARVCGHAEILTIPYVLFDALLDANKNFCRNLLGFLAERLEIITSLAGSLSLQTTRGRLAGFLLNIVDARANSRWYTQDEIAAEIGTVRDVVGRLLREFEGNGWLKRERQRIILLNRQALIEESQK